MLDKKLTEREEHLRENIKQEREHMQETLFAGE